jgi:hypothetical protein
MQIDGEDIKSLLVSMVLKNKILKMYRFEKTFFLAFLFGNGVNIFQFKIVQMTITTYET